MPYIRLQPQESRSLFFCFETFNFKIFTFLPTSTLVCPISLPPFSQPTLHHSSLDLTSRYSQLLSDSRSSTTSINGPKTTLHFSTLFLFSNRLKSSHHASPQSSNNRDRTSVFTPLDSVISYSSQNSYVLSVISVSSILLKVSSNQDKSTSS